MPRCHDATMGAFCRLIRAVLMCAWIVLASSNVSAQTGDWPRFNDAITSIPEDFEEALYADADYWAVLFWEWFDTGQRTAAMEGFQWTYPEHIPLDLSLFASAYDLFETVYADRLQLDPDLGEVYLLEDLFDDDPQVLNDFRFYTITGQFRTRLDDPVANIRHVQLLVSPNPCVIVANDASIWIDGNALVSRGLLSGGCNDDGNGRVQPVDCVQAPEACDFRDTLEHLWVNSCLRFAPYERDGFFSPGFDCDDYCESFWAWLKHKQDAGEFPADAEFQALWLYWRFTWAFGKGGKHGKVGHAVLIVRYNGYYYIVDTTSGQVSGPYPEDTPYEDVDWRDALDPTPDDPNDNDLPPYNPSRITRPKSPTQRPWNDPKPWHEDPEMRRRFEEDTGCDADDFIYS